MYIAYKNPFPNCLTTAADFTVPSDCDSLFKKVKAYIRGILFYNYIKLVAAECVGTLYIHFKNNDTLMFSC
ncbi:hypothetical protein XENTR_v10013581 [Xenopus tropicalis]|nr:hypothetical protein XENTR_v10013581 [Xenopus tropicalis]